MQDRNLYVIYGQDGCAMARQLLEAADVAKKIPPKAKIVLKPNLAVARPPEEGATTHTEIVEGTILYLREKGFSDITIAESSWLGDSTQRAFRVTGLDTLAKRCGVKLLDLKSDQTKSVDTAIGPMSICRTVLEADYLINFPVLKAHCQTVLTCALKNLKGCIPDSEKRRFHALGLMKPIAALGAALRPHLSIVDSICGDLTFEEGGNPVQTNRMLLGADPVQLDAYCCALLGVAPSDVGYLPLAQQYGAGSLAWRPEDVVALNEPVPSAEGRADGRLVRSLSRPVTQDSACSACFGNLIRALHQYREQTGWNYSRPISIGQGFRGKTPEGLGIGQCCRGAARGVPGCPPTAAEILKMLLDA